MKMRNMMLVALLAAGTAAAQECPGDVDGSGDVTVDEIVRAVDAGLNGCMEPTDEEILDQLVGRTWDVWYGSDATSRSFRFDDPPVREAGLAPQLVGVGRDLSNRVWAVAFDRRATELFGLGSELVIYEATQSGCAAFFLRVDGNRLYGYARPLDATCSRPLVNDRPIALGFRRDPL